MSRFGGVSEERPLVFKTRYKLGTHLSTQCSRDEKENVDLVQPVNRTPDLWCGSPIHYHSILFDVVAVSQAPSMVSNADFSPSVATMLCVSFTVSS
ncbi:hypothetical protein TNCV_2472441 [Trichonephila clavipes]|nr:hypothetical protein TNCV_2472441 [Trichonephila clavipes]